MKTTVVLGTVALTTVFYGCELQQQLVNEMQADANDFDLALCWGMRKSRPINPLSSQTKDSGRSCITLSQQRHESCGITRPSGGA